MKLAKPILLPGILALAFVCATSQTRPSQMAKWVGKYPDPKFFNQPQIRIPLRRSLRKADYDSVGEQHRKFSTKNNEFNLPHEVLDELGLKEQ